MRNAYTKLIETLPELRGVYEAVCAGRFFVSDVENGLLPGGTEGQGEFYGTGRPCLLGVTGLYSVHKAHLCAALCGMPDAKLILLAPDEGACARLAADMHAMGCAALVYPARELTFVGGDAHSREYEQKRLGVLAALLRGECSAVVTTAEAAAQRTIAPAALSSMVLEVTVGGDYKLQELVERFVRGGYTRCDQVEGTGQFSLRGGILDIFPPGAPQPYRLDFWDATLDSLAAFDPESQRRGEALRTAQITPAVEMYEEPRLVEESGREAAKLATLFDYLPDAILCVSESFSVSESFRAARELIAETAAQTLEHESSRGKQKAIAALVAGQTLDWSQVLREYENRCTLYLDTFPRGSFDTPVERLFSISANQSAAWSGSLSVLREDVTPLLEQSGQIICVLTQTEKAAESLAAELLRDGISAVHFHKIPENFPQNTVCVMHGALSAGFGYSQGNFTLFSATQKTEGTLRRR
jgi:transcription-repair coupling factor (superfamily II helicase)